MVCSHISPELRYALKKTTPVFFSYTFIGIAYGMTLREAGFGWIWALLASGAVYAGSLQFALVAFMASGASLATVALTALFVNSRHIFYGLSFIEPLKKSGRWYPYTVFALTDETYSVYCACAGDPACAPRSMAHMAWLAQLYWVAGSVLGALAGQYIPASFEGVEFSMTALFVSIAVDQLRDSASRGSALLGLGAAAACLIVLGPDRFMLPALALSAALLAAKSARRSRA